MIWEEDCWNDWEKEFVDAANVKGKILLWETD
jgi:hypothetical protein